jgi:hypothetical protein
MKRPVIGKGFSPNTYSYDQQLHVLDTLQHLGCGVVTVYFVGC